MIHQHAHHFYRFLWIFGVTVLAYFIHRDRSLPDAIRVANLVLWVLLVIGLLFFYHA